MEISKTEIPSPETMKRPLSVTILILMVLILTSLNVLQMSTAIRLRNFLGELLINAPASYLVITGAIWSVLGLTLTIGLFTRRKWSSSLTKISAIMYTIHYWVDRLLIADRFSTANRWPFTFGLTILLLASTFWILSRSRNKTYLMKYTVLDR